jgi:DNA-binding NarL/FixJ family response regulator
MIRVAIVEDRDDIRESLRTLIDEQEDFECRHAFPNAEEAIDKIPAIGADVVLMDINLPGINGIDCIKQLKQTCPSLQFMMMTVYEDDEKIFQSLEAGATGYLLKNTAPEKIFESVVELHQGGSPMSMQIARRVVQSFAKQSPSRQDGLSVREHEILELLTKGLLYKEVAARINISTETVRRHCHNIYRKLQVQNRVEAINKVYGSK